MRRWIDDPGLTEGWIIEIATETRGDHPNPPDGPKALDRFMERSARRDAQTATNTATDTAKSRKRRQARNADSTPRPSPEELAAFYADLVNSDKYLPASMIGNVMRDAMLAGRLVATAVTNDLPGSGSYIA